MSGKLPTSHLISRRKRRPHPGYNPILAHKPVIKRSRNMYCHSRNQYPCDCSMCDLRCRGERLVLREQRRDPDRVQDLDGKSPRDDAHIAADGHREDQEVQRQCTVVAASSCARGRSGGGGAPTDSRQASRARVSSRMIPIALCSVKRVFCVGRGKYCVMTRPIGIVTNTRRTVTQ